MRSERLVAAAASTLLLVPGAVATTVAMGEPPAKTVVGLRAANKPSIATGLYDADGDYLGYARFYDLNGEVGVRVRIYGGLTKGFHGLHIHSNDNPDNGSGCDSSSTPPFLAVDGHYQGDGNTHGIHDGDLPMLLVDDEGEAYLYTKASDDLNFWELDGRAVTIHSGPDNYANVPLGDEPTQYTANSQSAIDATNAAGNSGVRVACGVID